MTIANKLADELAGAMFDANPIDASVLGIRDREDRLPVRRLTAAAGARR